MKPDRESTALERVEEASAIGPCLRGHAIGVIWAGHNIAIVAESAEAAKAAATWFCEGDIEWCDAEIQPVSIFKYDEEDPFS